MAQLAGRIAEEIARRTDLAFPRFLTDGLVVVIRPRCSGLPVLTVGGAEHVDGGMTAGLVVPGLDPRKEGRGEPAAGCQPLSEHIRGHTPDAVLNRRRWDTRDVLRIAIVTRIERIYYRRRRQASSAA